jgi:hypothetical protein
MAVWRDQPERDETMQLKRALAAMVLGTALSPTLAACATGGGEAAVPDASPGFFARALGADDEPNAGPCPLMGALYETSRLVEFQDPNAQRYANIAFTGEVQGVRGLCRYVGEAPIVMSIEVDMAFGRGPAARTNERAYTYWVAVVRRSSGLPLAKQYYTVDVRFPSGEDVMATTQTIEGIVIPRANADISGENFEVMVGFELTEDQLAFNREGRRFRVNAPGS